MIKEDKKRVAVSLNLKTFEKLDDYANKTGFTKSVIIELALKNYLRNK
ncbi:ribbon-helix-helix domain-containing protein [Streptococcus suis]